MQKLQTTKHKILAFCFCFYFKFGIMDLVIAIINSLGSEVEQDDPALNKSLKSLIFK